MSKDNQNKYDLIIIGGGPSGLALAQCYSKTDKNILIIDKESDIGGCHRVRRLYDQVSDQYLFTEHGPRIYSDTYQVFISLLKDMNINFYDLFVEYNFTISQIGGETVWSTVTYTELSYFVIEFIKLIFNNNHGNDILMQEFLIKNNFKSKSIDIIDRICRLTDGAGIDKYTLNEFLQLFNQQFFHTIYQPKYPNDIGLFKMWKAYLLKNNVSFLLNSTVTDLITNKTNDQIEYIIINNNQKIYCNKVVTAIPPVNIIKLFENSENLFLKNSFGDFNLLKAWSQKTAYIDYISMTFHWDSVLDLPKIYGFPKTSWGVAYIVLSDYMTFQEKSSKTVISIAITIIDNPSHTINKTANQCFNTSELIIETFNQLKESFPKLPPPTFTLLSPGVYYDKFKNQWISNDTAYIASSISDPISPEFASKTITNLYNLGTHNNKSLYKFTSLESAVTNAIELSHLLDPKLKEIYPITSAFTVREFIIILIIIICILYLYYKNKNER